MSRKTRNLLVSAVVLAVVAAALIILRNTGGEEEPVDRPERPQSVVLSELSAAELRSVKVDNPDGGYHFFSSDGAAWQMADTPEYYRLDTGGALTAIRLFGRLGGQEVEAEADASRLAEFGLDEPEATVTLRDAEGGIVILEFGAMSPTGSGRFARRAGSPSVALVSAHAARAVTAVPGDFRNMRLPGVNIEALAGFSFRSGATLFIAEPRQEEDAYVTSMGPFEVVSPYRGRYPLDDFALNRQLTETSPLPIQVREWLDDADPADPALGLGEEEADLISIFDAEGGALLLRIGASDGDGSRYAMLADREDAVFLLSDTDVRLLEARPFDLVSRFMFLANIVDVAQVKGESGSDVWIMQREELGDPELSKDDSFYIGSLPVDHSDYTSLYQKFIGLMWEGEIAERRSIEFPVLRITVSHDSPGVKNRIIRFWEYDDVYYQATVGDDPLEFLVGKYQVGLFLEELKALSEYAS